MGSRSIMTTVKSDLIKKDRNSQKHNLCYDFRIMWTA